MLGQKRGVGTATSPGNVVPADAGEVTWDAKILYGGREMPAASVRVNGSC